MAKKLKFDASVLKTYFFLYGDKLALAVCAGVMLLLVGLGLLNASTASRTDWARDIDTAAKSLQGRHQQAELRKIDPALVEALDAKLYIWTRHDPHFLPGPFVNIQEQADVKRRNPTVKALKSNPESFQLDYVRSLYFCYDIERNTRKAFVFAPAAGAAGNQGFEPIPKRGPNPAAASTPDMVKAVEPRRIVIVSGIFPMREQLEEFKAALRLPTQKELFDAKENLPRFVGLDVVRFEVTPEGNGEQVTLYSYDKAKGEATAARDIQEVLSKAFYEPESLAWLEAFVHSGVVTPLPLLANASYPKLNLPGLDPVEDPKGEREPGGMPKRVPGPMGPQVPGGALPNPQAPMAAGQGRTVKAMAWKNLPAELRERFEGKINPLHPLGVKEEPAESSAEEKKTTSPFPTVRPGLPGPNGTGATSRIDPFAKFGLTEPENGKGPANPVVPFPMGKNKESKVSPQAADTLKWGHDALVRFIDVSVEPGKTYRYQIKVWLANPNYGKKTLVAFEALAREKDFASPPATTPPLTIPGEYQYYAVDQFALNNNNINPRNVPWDERDKVAMQIHRWFDIGKDSQNGIDYPVGDWAILERLMLRRGDVVGQYQHFTKVPVWNKEEGAFEIPQMQVQGRVKLQQKPGIPLDFVPPADPAKKGLTFMPPVLVDYDGGKKDSVRVTPTLTIPMFEESAVGVLILTPEGKLIVRHARQDADILSPEGKERQERVEAVQERVQQAQNGGAATVPGGPGVGGVPGVPGVPPRRAPR